MDGAAIGSGTRSSERKAPVNRTSCYSETEFPKQMIQRARLSRVDMQRGQKSQHWWLRVCSCIDLKGWSDSPLLSLVWVQYIFWFIMTV